MITHETLLDVLQARAERPARAENIGNLIALTYCAVIGLAIIAHALLT